MEREAGSLMTESAHGGQSRISLSRGRVAGEWTAR